MEKIDDYSGEFLPDLELSNFSSDTLARLLKVYSKLYMALDGFWYLAVKDRLGNKEALACDGQAWENICKYEMAKISKQLNIQGNDVMALIKTIQMTPLFQQMQFGIEVQNHNRAVLTITYCPTLNILEKEGKGREAEICNIVDRKGFKDYASFFNPDIEVKPLKPLPRKSKNDVCCQWEFSYNQ